MRASKSSSAATLHRRLPVPVALAWLGACSGDTASPIAAPASDTGSAAAGDTASGDTTAATDAATDAAGSGWAGPWEREPWTCARGAEVVVVGAGPAGLAVASRLDAALLVEADDEPGGRIRYTPAPAGMFVDCPGQDADADGLDRALDEWEALTGEPPTEATEAWLAATPEVYDRLVDMGLTPRPTPARVLWGLSNHNMDLGGGGDELVEALLADVGPGVELCTGRRIDGVLTRDGAVTGVVSAGVVVPARAVVIATGGFAGDRGWVAEITGWDEDDPWAASGGSASAMALDQAAGRGWGTARLDAIGWSANAIGIAGSTSTPMLVDYGDPVPWIWVDADGARFVDEGDPFSLAPARLLLEREVAWAVGTRADLEDRVLAEDLAVLAAAIEAGEEVACAGDPESLAERIGVDPDGLAATVAEVERIRAGESADPFGRESLPELAGELCAWPPGLAATKAFGGLDVDAEGRVRDVDGAVITGLYAAGEAAGMGVPGMGGAHGFDGSITAVLWSGWRVGDTVRADLAAASR